VAAAGDSSSCESWGLNDYIFLTGLGRPDFLAHAVLGFFQCKPVGSCYLGLRRTSTQELVKEFIRRLASTSGYTPIKISFLEMIKQNLEETQLELNNLRTNNKSLPHLTLVLEDLKCKDKSMGLADHLGHSRAQLAQDLFVLSTLHDNQRARFFVEFGATNGITLSNTYLLEKHFGWNGILAEPARCWHSSLMANRNCVIDHRCVYHKTGEEVDFLEVDHNLSDGLYITPELSGIAAYADSGDWASPIRRNHSSKYLVETVSLNDLLIQHNAPYEIGYLSIDTEGSELEILQAFNFKSHKIHVITVEHNYQNDIRSGLYTLLTRNGFKRVFEDISAWDDWYVISES
jgi:FkbM family methyltransferase